MSGSDALWSWKDPLQVENQIIFILQTSTTAVGSTRSQCVIQHYFDHTWPCQACVDITWWQHVKITLENKFSRWKNHSIGNISGLGRDIIEIPKPTPTFPSTPDTTGPVLTSWPTPMKLFFHLELWVSNTNTVSVINQHWETSTHAQLDQTWSKSLESFWISMRSQSSPEMCPVEWLFHLEMGSPTLFQSSTDIRKHWHWHYLVGHGRKYGIGIGILKISMSSSNIHQMERFSTWRWVFHGHSISTTIACHRTRLPHVPLGWVWSKMWV